MSELSGQHVNLRHLRAFAEVCRQGSVSAAADVVHLSQPAITQAVARLEAALEAPLFARNSRGMVPTGAGRLLAARADRALGILRAGVQEAARRGGGGGGFELSITATQLRALLAVAEHGNFSLAARALGVSQPSIYRVARELEKVSDMPLYARTPTGFDLTRAATVLARAARLTFAELDQAIAEVAESRGQDAAAITLGGLPLARSTILPLALSRMARARPMMRMRVVEGPYGDLLHALRHGEIDLLIGALRDPAPAEDVAQEELFRDRLGVFAGPAHPLAGGASVIDADLARYPWVVPRPGAPTRAAFDAFAARLGLAGGRTVIETSSMVLVRSLLQDGEHLTMLSVNQMRFEEERGSVRRLPVALGDTPRPIGLARRRDWHPTAAQSEFIGLLRDVSASFG